MGRLRLVDLSQPIRNFNMETQEGDIVYYNHKDIARQRVKKWGISPNDFEIPGVFAATEIVTASTHLATHMDAPWHYGPTCEGKPAKTIDEIPLEWCYGDGVVLDFTEKKPEELITAEDIGAKLKEMSYEIKPFDIVLIRTDASKYRDESDYDQRHAGLSRDAVFYLVERGVKVTGTDGWGLDSPSGVMLGALKKGDRKRFYPAHMAGREKEYVHLEKMANLDQLPSYGFKVAVFPVLIERASGAWVRAVAFVEE